MRSNRWLHAAGIGRAFVCLQLISLDEHSSEAQGRARRRHADEAANRSIFPGRTRRRGRGIARSSRRPAPGTGQYVTPTALHGAVQQVLEPGFAAYPNFIAGEAVRSQLSPDGRTLAVLCAGQNSLVKPDGSTDVPASTQFIFCMTSAARTSARHC